MTTITTRPLSPTQIAFLLRCDTESINPQGPSSKLKELGYLEYDGGMGCRLHGQRANMMYCVLTAKGLEVVRAKAAYVAAKAAIARATGAAQ